MIVRYGGGAIKVDVDSNGFSPSEPVTPRVRIAIMGVTTVYLTTGEATAVAEALVVAIKEARKGN